MRWPIIRLIWRRELRDQLRDRRTLFMIAGLPLLLYPVLGFAVLQFAVGFVQKPSTIGLVSGPFRCRDFPPRAPDALPACLALAPAAPPGAGLPPNQLAAAAALAYHPALAYPPLVRDGRLSTAEAPAQVQPLLRLLAGKLRLKFLDPAEAEAALENREVDLLLSARPDFWNALGAPGSARAAL